MTHAAQWVYQTNVLRTTPMDEFHSLKVLCYLQFLKNTICLNRNKSLLLVNYSNIICKNNENFAMKRRFAT